MLLPGVKEVMARCAPRPLHRATRQVSSIVLPEDPTNDVENPPLEFLVVADFGYGISRAQLPE
jgi:hypothetical protein